jgi:hypothetical protein
MNPDSQDFDSLRRLLAIKRHEQPPPGYFDRFSRDVMARIKSGDQGEGSANQGWWQRLWRVLETKPAFAGAFGASVCAFLISGLLNSEESGGDGAANPVVSQANSVFHPVPTMALNESTSSTVETTLAADPVASPSLNSLFDFQGAVQPATFSYQGGN